MDEEEIAKMDHEEIVAKQVEELNKEKKELQVLIYFSFGLKMIKSFLLWVHDHRIVNLKWK